MKLPASVLALALSATAMAQQSSAPPAPQDQHPIFRLGTDIVRVDVYPRSRGRVVEGLQATDFELYEDGVKQTIEAFAFIPAPAGETPPLDPRSPDEARRMAADPLNRVFVFYLDAFSVTREGSFRSRDPLLEFLRTTIGPRDLFAVMLPKHSAEFLEFGRMTQEVATMMSLGKPWGIADSPVEDPDEMELEACAPGRDGRPGPLVNLKRTVEVYTDLEELILHLGALRQERKNLVVISERWQARPVRLPRGGAAVLAPARYDAGGGQRGRGSFVPPPSPMLDFARKCQAMQSYLRGQLYADRLRELPERARRANVALYFVSAAPENLSNTGMARTLAEETDGLSIVSNDLGWSLQHVLDHQTGYYMLGYRSTAGASGTKARTIRVRTTRSGVDLDIRRLYDPLPPGFDAAAAARPPEPNAIERALAALASLRDTTDVFVRGAVWQGHADVVVELNAEVAARAPWRSGGAVSIVVRDESGADAGSAAGTFAAGQRSVRLRVPVAAGSPTLTARIRLSQGELSLSDSFELVAAPADAVLGPPTVFRAGALPRDPYVPAADLRFARTERLRLDWPLAATAATPVVQLLGAAGVARPVAVEVQTLADPPRLRADLRLLSLAPGDYVIEVTARGAAGVSRQLLAIQVRR